MSHTILLVEDEVLIRMAVSFHLQGCGFRILEAENADEALALLVSEPKIDLVFTDVRMPGSIDGLGLAKWLLSHRPRIAVIIASGDSAKEKLVRGLDGVLVFSKPYNYEELTECIRQLIENRHVS